MRASLLAAVTFVVMLGAAPSARAELIRLDSPGSQRGLAAGPVFAGGALVWAETRPAFGVAVRSWRPGGPVRTVADLPAQPRRAGLGPQTRRVALHASSTDLVVATQLERYDGRGEGPTILGADALRGPLDGPLAPVAPATAPVRVTDGAAAVATADGTRIESRDGSGREPVVLEGRATALDGSVVSLADERATRIVNWRTGAEIFRVARTDGAVADVQENGLALIGTATGAPSIALASPDRPRPAGLPVALAGLDLELAADRVAFASNTSVGVVARDGELVGLTRIANSPRVGRLAFDGRTVAWATRPCVVTHITTWTPGASPPALASTVCAPARPPRSARVRIRRDGAVIVPLTCPSYVRDGCPTRLEVRIRPIRDGRPSGPYRLLPARLLDQLAGEREEVAIRTFLGQRSLILRSRRLDLLVATSSGDALIRRRLTAPAPRST